MPLTIKALTLYQPYATLVALELKRNETRGRRINYRGPLAIHAAKTIPEWCLHLLTMKVFMHALAEAGIGGVSDLPLGCVLCTVNLSDCYQVVSDAQIPDEPERSYGDYSRGRFVIPLQLIKRFEKPIPARGFQWLWDWVMPEGLAYV